MQPAELSAAAQSELAAGALVWPAWAIALLGAASVALGVAFAVVRLRRRRRP